MESELGLIILYLIRHRVDSIESFHSGVRGLCIDLGQNDAYIARELRRNFSKPNDESIEKSEKFARIHEI